MHKALGKGLDALISANAGTPASVKGDEIRSINVTQIKPNRYQARVRFDDSKLQELAESIQKHGVAQPLVITPGTSSDAFELVAGERRLRASILAGLSTVPCIIRTMSDEDRFEISLIENIQREDLNPMEEARAIQALGDKFNLTQEQIAKTLGRSRSGIANTLRLLSLSADIQIAIESGKISEGHARTLASLNDPKAQSELVRRISVENLSVREVEKIVSDWSEALDSGRIKTPKRRNPDTRHYEESLQRIMGRQVAIQGRGKKGWVKIAFYSPEDLERLRRQLEDASRPDAPAPGETNAAPSDKPPLV